LRWRSILVLLALVGAAGACTADDADGGAAASSTSTTPSTVDPAVDPATAAGPGAVATANPVPSAGCGTSAAAGPTQLERRTLPGSDRWYLLTVPTAHDGTTPLPVVLDFHGLLEGAELHATTSGMGPYAEAHGFVAVLPNGTGTPVRWDVDPDRAANADLVFVDQLLDQLEQDLCLDTSRVYATGLSNGALLSSTIACTMADRFAAVAPMAGAARPSPCDPSRPVPLLAFHGTVDPILLFNGGVGGRLTDVLAGGEGAGEAPPEADLDGAGYPAAAAAWAAGNGCAEEPSETDLTPTVIERSWDCPAGAAVIFEILVGSGHSWPGSELLQRVEQVVGPTDMSVDGTDMIWRFFQRFALPAG
jgi:polyhydroxybutyrate depolymerase